MSDNTKIKPLPLQIAELYQAVKDLQNENRALKAYLNEIGSMLCMKPLSEVSDSKNSAFVSAAQTNTNSSQIIISVSEPSDTPLSQTKPESTPEEAKESVKSIVYAPQIEILSDGTSGFLNDYLSEEENIYKLALKGEEGQFEFNNDEKYAAELAGSIEDKIAPLAEYELDPTLEDSADAIISNITVGKLKLLNGEWTVVEKAKIRIENKKLKK